MIPPEIINPITPRRFIDYVVFCFDKPAYLETTSSDVTQPSFIIARLSTSTNGGSSTGKPYHIIGHSIAIVISYTRIYKIHDNALKIVGQHHVQSSIYLP